MRRKLFKPLFLCLICALALVAAVGCQETTVEHVHSIVYAEGVEATCSTSGRTAGEKCTLCGQMTLVPKTIPALGHVFSDEWVIDREPTELEAGERSRHCYVCGERSAISEIPRLVGYTEGLSYELNEQGNGYICTGIGSATGVTELHIPATYQGLPVTKIAMSAFANNNKLVSLNVGSGVKFIDKGAFMGCSKLKSIELPDTVEYIASHAFTSTAYYKNKQMWENDTLYIGNHLISVRAASVGASYTIRPSTRTIGGTAFYGCTQLISIEIPEGVLSIGNSAFYGCSALRSITLPASLKTIGPGAIAYCKALQEFTLSSGVQEILSNPFPGCSALRFIHVDENNEHFMGINNCLIERSTGTLYSVGIDATLPADGSIRAIGMAAFYQNKAMTDIVLPEGVETICQSAFFECINLQSVTLPSSLKYIENEAFSSCSNLKSITLPRGVVSLGESAFASCNRLSTVQLFEGLVSIGPDAFASCFSLKQINLPDSLLELGAGAFAQCTQLQTESYGNALYLNDWVVGVENRSVFEVSLKPTTKGIASSAFSGCENLQSLVLPDTIIFIGDQAFLHCWRLTELRIPEGVQRLNEKTLAYCSGLTDLYLPASLTHIGSQALFSCSALKTIHVAGTPQAWDAMQKDEDWADGAIGYAVQFSQ